jgi:hypothetical protein
MSVAPGPIVALSSADKTGLFSLAGVLIGGVLAALLSALHDWRTRRRQGRKARLLAAADLEQAQKALVDVDKNMKGPRDWPVGGNDQHPEDRRWPAGWERVLWTKTWTDNRGALADALDDSTFRELAPAFGLLGQLQNSLAAGQRPFVADDPDFVTRAKRQIDRALKRLQEVDRPGATSSASSPSADARSEESRP